MYDAASGLLISRRRYTNVACQNGKAFLASLLNIENPAYTIANVYGAVGTSGAAVASTDVQLGAEFARAVLGSNSRSANVVTFQFFFNTSQGNGTWAEAGCFLGASGTANSGSLLSHVLLSEVKTNTVTATLNFALQIG
jgi:hypothetical protein